VRLGYFAMPMHRPGRPWMATLNEDREAVILADRLGFYDAFIGEHLTDDLENVTNSMLFLATLISETTQIKLATGTTNLSHMHPVLVAVHAAMFDHLSAGRFILGISPGALPSDAEVLGILDEDRSQLFSEAIDVIVKVWQGTPPYDIVSPGGRFTVSSAKTMDLDLGVGRLARPFQQPRPEIVGTVVSPFSAGAVAMGRQDFHPLSANFLLPKWVGSHWSKYSEGKQSVGQEPQVADWRVARTVLVADDDRVAREYGGAAPDSPYRFYYQQMVQKMTKLGRLAIFKTDPSEPDDAVTVDRVLTDLVICGTPASVTEQILAFQEETGPFGELVYAGLDWIDPELAKRSMELMATKVMPSVNQASGLQA